MGDFQVFTLARLQLGAKRELQHPEHAVHRRTDLVAHVGEKLTLRPARRFRGLTRASLRLLRPYAIGDVDDGRKRGIWLRGSGVSQGTGVDGDPSRVAAGALNSHHAGCRAARDQGND